MDTNKSLEILKMAILMERKGHAFYSQVAKTTQSQIVKDIFETMAKEEILHEKFLSETFKSILKENKVKSLELPAQKDVFTPLVLTEELKKQISASSYEAAAISAAIDMENNAIKVYAEFADKAPTEEEKKLFTWLSNWEKTHHQVLHEMDKELKEAVWFDNQFWPF
ncbi:MAG: ferritin family protein [Bacteroidales bacterium]|nr:ferritin family protein [Bacteroidales bacterium]